MTRNVAETHPNRLFPTPQKYRRNGSLPITFVRVKALLLTGPSGSGKTTLAQALLREYSQLQFSISATTRAPRPGEVHGRDYYFLSEAEFDAEIAQGGFIEWEVLFSGHRYGTLRREIERLQKTGAVPLLVKDVKGTLALRSLLGAEALSIFLLPPSVEVLRQRLLQRGLNDLGELEERLHRALEEIQLAARFDFILYNDEIDQALDRMKVLLSRYLS